MKIDTDKVLHILNDRTIAANLIERETGVKRSVITRIRNGERKFENLTIETVMKIQKWIDETNFTPLN